MFFIFGVHPATNRKTIIAVADRLTDAELLMDEAEQCGWTLLELIF